MLRFEYAAELGLDLSLFTPGCELDEAQSSALSLATEATEAERRALALLASAEQCRAGLAAKLERRGLSRRAVALALTRLERMGLLDDMRYAEAWIRMRIGRSSGGQRVPEGPNRLLEALRSRGLADEVARAALFAVLDEEARHAMLDRAARLVLDRFGASRGRVTFELKKLGFTATEIRAYFEDRA